MDAGLTDVISAKGIGKLLFARYAEGGQLTDASFQRMMKDTYMMMVLRLTQNKEFEPTPFDCELYLGVLDFNSDGLASVEDLQSLAIKYLAKAEPRSGAPLRAYTKQARDRLQVAQRLFEKFDKDRTGFLGESEIPELLIETYAMMGVKFTPTAEDIASWKQMADADGDGRVNLADYRQLIISSLETYGIPIFEGS